LCLSSYHNFVYIFFLSILGHFCTAFAFREADPFGRERGRVDKIRKRSTDVGNFSYILKIFDEIFFSCFHQMRRMNLNFFANNNLYTGFFGRFFLPSSSFFLILHT
jgi:hypothetical protein